MDFEARRRLFTIGIIAIEQNETLTAAHVHRLLEDPPSDQPRFTDTDVSGIFLDNPATFEVPPTLEVHSVSSDSSNPESYHPEESYHYEVQSDSSTFDPSSTRPWWRRMGKHASKCKVYKDSHSRESRIGSQRLHESDVEEEHRAARLVFSPEQACAYDVEPNVIGPTE